MYYSPRKAIGFQIDENLAEEMGLLEEFKQWRKDGNEEPFAKGFKAKFKPPGEYLDIYIQEFVAERGGEVQGLHGFDYGTPYVYFPDIKRTEKGWRPFIKKMEGKFLGLYFADAEWSQLT